MLSFTIGLAAITVFLDGNINTVDSSHANFRYLAEELRKPAPGMESKGEEPRSLDRIRTLVSIRKMLESKTIGNVEITTTGAIRYKGNEVNNYMTQRMLQILGEGYDITPWARFMDNVMENPASYAHAELYEWMERADMPITEDGCFIAFKKVRSDYTDCYTGKFSNAVGTTLEMDRTACDPKRTNHCSTGFHFCSAGYLSKFSGERVMVLKINPRDVTSIPNDYGFTKGRCCRYDVIGELASESEAYKQAWRKGVVTFEDAQELPEVAFQHAPKPLTTLPPMQAPELRPSAAMKGTVHVVKPAGGGTGTGVVTAGPDLPSLFVPAGTVIASGILMPGPNGAMTATLVAETGPRIQTSPFREGAQASAAAVRAAVKSDAGPVPISFSTKDGRDFLVDELKVALIASGDNNRAAARALGIRESTLRGWRKKARF